MASFKGDPLRITSILQIILELHEGWSTNFCTGEHCQASMYYARVKPNNPIKKEKIVLEKSILA